MINRVVILVKSIRHINTKSIYRFSNDISDPYYILGLQKNTDIAEVKKAFYKLANEYHPDKIGDDKNSAQKFLLIKQAYEAIKMQKGLIKPVGYVYDHDVKSMRPDPSRFDTDDQENRQSQADYRMYQEKAEAGGEEYENFKGTFKTLNDINDIKIRVEKGEVKDSSKRLGLQNLRARVQAISGNGAAFYGMIGIAAGIFIYSQFQAQNQKQSHILKSSIQLQEQNQKKRRIFDEQQQNQKNIRESVEKSPEIKQYLKQNKRINKKYEIETGQNAV